MKDFKLTKVSASITSKLTVSEDSKLLQTILQKSFDEMAMNTLTGGVVPLDDECEVMTLEKLREIEKHLTKPFMDFKFKCGESIYRFDTCPVKPCTSLAMVNINTI